jgi:hypothetical protein
MKLGDRWLMWLEKQCSERDDVLVEMFLVDDS